MNRLLVIGYGNPYRRDDGVALHVINALRQRIGVRALPPDEDGLDEVGRTMDSVMLHQLLPEMTPLLAEYQRVVFVDAHTGAIPDAVRVVSVEEEYSLEAVTHHMSPGMLLALARLTNGYAPQGYLVSVKGEDFDFGTELSEACRERVDVAVESIRNLARSAGRV